MNQGLGEHEEVFIIRSNGQERCYPALGLSLAVGQSLGLGKPRVKRLLIKAVRCNFKPDGTLRVIVAQHILSSALGSRFMDSHSSNKICFDGTSHEIVLRNSSAIHRVMFY